MKKLVLLLALSLCLQPISFADETFERNEWEDGTKSGNYDDLKGPEGGLKPKVDANVASAEVSHEVSGLKGEGKVGDKDNFAKGDVKVGSAEAKGEAAVGPTGANMSVNASVNLLQASGKGQLSTGSQNLGIGLKGGGNVDVGAMAGMNGAANLDSKGLNLEAGGKVHFGPQAGGTLAATLSLLGIKIDVSGQGGLAAGLGLSGNGIVNLSWTKLQLGGSLGGVAGVGGFLGTNLTVDVSGFIDKFTNPFETQPWTTTEMEQVRQSVDRQITEIKNQMSKDPVQQFIDSFSLQGFADYARQGHLQDLERFRDELDRQLGRSSNGRILEKVQLGKNWSTVRNNISLPYSQSAQPIGDAAPSAPCDPH